MPKAKPAKRFLCPVCCEKSMVERLVDDKYYLICEKCGTRRGPLPDKRHLAPPEA